MAIKLNVILHNNSFIYVTSYYSLTVKISFGKVHKSNKNVSFEHISAKSNFKILNMCFMLIKNIKKLLD